MKTNPATEIEDLILLLGRTDVLGPNPALEKLKNIGEPAIPRLLDVIDGDNLTAIVNAIKVLTEMGAKQAIPKLRMLAESKWAEVHQASLTALAVLDRDTANILELDYRQPYEQLGRLWTAIVQSRKMLYPQDVLRDYCLNAIEAMPRLAFESDDKRARAWGMLGGLIFKALGETKPCPEAKKCYEEALKIQPNSNTWQDRVKEFFVYEFDSASLDDLVVEGKTASSWLQTLADPNSRIHARSDAVDALSKAGVRVVPPLIEYLKSQRYLVWHRGQDGFTNQPVNEALIRIGKPAVPYLRNALTDPNSKEGIWIAYLLSKLGESDHVLPMLIKHVEEKSELQFWAMSAIAGIGPEVAEETVPILLKSLDGVKLGFESDVAEALGEMRDPRAVEPLIRLLGHSHAMVRGSAALALMNINDKRAIEPLRRALRRETGSTWEIKEALEKLGPGVAKPQPTSQTSSQPHVEKPRVAQATREPATETESPSLGCGIALLVAGTGLVFTWWFYSSNVLAFVGCVLLGLGLLMIVARALHR